MVWLMITFKNFLNLMTVTFNLRNRRDLKVPLVKSVWKGENSIRYFGALLWNTIPNEIKNVASLAIYKTKIRQWKPQYCPCRLCKNYIHGIGFVDIAN